MNLTPLDDVIAELGLTEEVDELRCQAKVRKDGYSPGHRCTGRAVWVSMNHGRNILWCQGRYDVWQENINDWTRCWYCFEPTSHWTVLPL